jgi:hypothetical protein
MSLNFPYFSLPQIPRETIFPKIRFWGLQKGWLVSASSLQGAADPTYKGKLSPISFPWGSFGHKLSELLSVTIKFPHGDPRG